MLQQNDFNYAHFPELVDLAVIGTGLGLVRANVALVNNKGSYWDSTQWLSMPKPFLDAQSLAYAMAIAAWCRGEHDPPWASDLPTEIKAPMKKSLKYLHKTNDCFFQPNADGGQSFSLPQKEWWQLANSKSPSTGIIAFHQLRIEEPLAQSQQNLLVDKLRSSNRAILLHAIGAAEQAQEASEPIVDELRLLAEHRDNEVRAKAMCALTRLAQLDEATIRLAANMLDSKTRFVTYSGILALASQESLSTSIMPIVDRGFIQSLQNCDYEFMGLYAAAYHHWTEDPKAHFDALLQHDSPEFLEMASEALQNVREQLVALQSQ